MTSVAIHVDQLFYRVPGGIGTYVRRLLPALREADPGLDLTVFHSRFPGISPAELHGYRRVAMRRGIRSLYPLWNLTGRPPLPKEIEAGLIHAPAPVAIPPLRKGQRLVVTLHDLAFRLYPQAYRREWRALHSAGLRRAAGTATAIIAVSRHTADDAARLAGIDPSRIHVVPLAGSLPVGAGDPEPVLERLGISRPYLLFVGNLEPRKNVGRLLRAFEEVAPRVPHSLVLTGPISRRARAAGLGQGEGSGRIVVTGSVPEEHLDALYRGADAFAYPSLYEGFGLPVLDAMARGIPVVTSDSSALAELAGDSAIRIPPGSTGAIAEALELVLTDEAERKRLSKAGHVRALDFSWDRTALATLDVYEKALAS